MSEVSAQGADWTDCNTLERDHRSDVSAMPGRGGRTGDHARSRPLAGECQSPIRATPPDKAHQGAGLAILAAGVPGSQTKIAKPVDKFVLCLHNWGSTAPPYQRVYRAAKACLSERSHQKRRSRQKPINFACIQRAGKNEQ